VFDAVWNEVRRDYFDPGLKGVDWRQARAELRPRALAATSERELYTVINDLLDRLDDDHASAHAPAVVRRQDSLRQRRAVIGIRMSEGDDGRYRIESVPPGSAAEAAGLMRGDILTRIQDRPVSNAGSVQATVGIAAPGTALDARYLRDGREGRTRLVVGESDIPAVLRGHDALMALGATLSLGKGTDGLTVMAVVRPPKLPPRTRTFLRDMGRSFSVGVPPRSLWPGSPGRCLGPASAGLPGLEQMFVRVLDLFEQVLYRRTHVRSNV